MSKKTNLIRLLPQGVVLEAPRDANLLKFLQTAGIAVGSACGGQGICGSCKITVLKNPRGLSRPQDLELEISERNNLANNERISCQCEIEGDIDITTSYW